MNLELYELLLWIENCRGFWRGGLWKFLFNLYRSYHNPPPHSHPSEQAINVILGLDFGIGLLSSSVPVRHNAVGF